ncbi:syntaxin 8 [Exophiala viscosa]|uniref:syntaxin 8 n=1 Tax=Exophiala viscosa TaxID=2486360 RepID=UPI0021A0C3F4|nr:syntaxin 8 [Exophiala viscosa]
MSNPSQLLLLADHIKLSLLERQRAISLNLDPNPSQDSNITRSLESFRKGIETVSSKPDADSTTVDQLRSQYADLSRQFHGESSNTSTTKTLSSPNDPALKEDFARAQTRKSPSQQRSSNLRKQDSASAAAAKNVRFRDNPSQESLDAEDETNRAALFPSRYTDEDSDRAKTPDPAQNMSNVQIHAYHQQVISEQDDQLDRLGESIGRQRHLAMQVGDELEGQIALLDEVDRGVDRHQGRLDGAKRRLKGVSETAKKNWGMTTIIILIVILVLLIALLK